MSAQPLIAPRHWPAAAPAPTVNPGGHRAPEQSRTAAAAVHHATLPGLQLFPRSIWLVWAGSAVSMLVMLAIAGTLRGMNVATQLELQSVNRQIAATQDETIALQRAFRTQVRERNDRALLVASDPTLVASGTPLTVTIEPVTYHPAASESVAAAPVAE